MLVIHDLAMYAPKNVLRCMATIYNNIRNGDGPNRFDLASAYSAIAVRTCKDKLENMMIRQSSMHSHGHGYGQSNGTKRNKKSGNNYKKMNVQPQPAMRPLVCYDYNDPKGCTRSPCTFLHVCSGKGGFGCGKAGHPYFKCPNK